MSNVSNEYNEALLEPLKYYREELKDSFQRVTEEYFQQLVDQSKVDIDNNKVLIDKYTAVSENRDQSNTSYKRFGIIKKIDIVIGIGAIIYGIYQFFTKSCRYRIYHYLYCGSSSMCRFISVLD